MDIIVFACAEVDVCLTLLTSRARIITFKDHSVFWNIARGEGFARVCLGQNINGINIKRLCRALILS